MYVLRRAALATTNRLQIRSWVNKQVKVNCVLAIKYTTYVRRQVEAVTQSLRECIERIPWQGKTTLSGWRASEAGIFCSNQNKRDIVWPAGGPIQQQLGKQEQLRYVHTIIAAPQSHGWSNIQSRSTQNMPEQQMDTQIKLIIKKNPLYFMQLLFCKDCF